MDAHRAKLWRRRRQGSAGSGALADLLTISAVRCKREGLPLSRSSATTRAQSALSLERHRSMLVHKSGVNSAARAAISTAGANAHSSPPHSPFQLLFRRQSVDANQCGRIFLFLTQGMEQLEILQKPRHDSNKASPETAVASASAEVVGAEAVVNPEEEFIVLQTENGQQVTMPVSALPENFDPAQSGQVIMVEDTNYEQEAEVVVETTTNEETIPLETHITDISHLQSHELIQADIPISTTGQGNYLVQTPVTSIAINPSTLRTYSRNCSIKSYAPTCGQARIYLLPQSTFTDHLQLELNKQSSTTSSNQSIVQQLGLRKLNSIESKPQADPPITDKHEDKQVVEEVVIPRKKQKRKEVLHTKTLNEEDLQFEFEIFDEPEHHVVESPSVSNEAQTKRTKRAKRIVDTTSTERRTRLSNSYRVPTSKNYKCNDCDFSTDRINNIVCHVRTNSCRGMRS